MVQRTGVQPLQKVLENLNTRLGERAVTRVEFAETRLLVKGSSKHGGHGAEKLPVDRHDLAGRSHGNIHNSLELMPVQGISFPVIEKTGVD